ncbi:MAG: GTP-binding protein [Clostridiales bacterium]|nr:GTP-binding protein [Clostridiales bacterium]
MKKVIPITLLTGYLGSGKTTLLNYVLTNQQGYKVAVIVNDIGEVNVDASLIAKGGIVNDTEGSLVPLQNGCICCTLKEDLMKQIADLAASDKFDYILIEASGICEPVPIVQTIEVLSQATKRYNLPCEIRLDNVVSVVDALRLVDEFGSGRELLKEELDEEDIENLIIQQIEFCNKIIINKASEVSKEQMEEVKAVVRAIQPEAEILEADYGKVALDKILNTSSFNFEKASMSAAWIKQLNEPTHEHEEECEHNHNDEDECHCHEEGHECHCHDHDADCKKQHNECHCHEHNHEEHNHKGHCHCHHHHGEGECLEYGIDTFVYTKRQPFNKQKFINFMENFPKSVIRAKGVIWVSADEENMYMFEQAGKQKNAMNVGPWVASLPKQEQEIILLENADIRADWRDDVGDRIIKLVFIGKHMNKHQIIKDLNNCLE